MSEGHDSPVIRPACLIGKWARYQRMPFP
jgi:hypothetical protein